jgi:4-hydroxybenzoyl-CoA thioesterase/acyl-CoA thioester hydrolase
MSDPRDSGPITEFRTKRTVEFADADMGGIVHFARYFVFMETAEHEFLRSLGSDAFSTTDAKTIGWPRVEVSCQYLSPAKYGDELEIHLRVARKGTSSLTYAITISTAGRLVARGRMSSVCCLMGNTDGLETIPMPDALSRRIAASNDADP